ncbi:MAG: TonB-dependent receptor [Bacteroidota bacterium]
MKRGVLTLVGVVWAIAHLNAQSYTVSGTVLSSESEEPLEAATVFVRSLNVQTNTDSTGYYQFQLSSGTYTLQAFSTGMEIASKQIDVQEDTEVNFRLAELSQNLEEVEVFDTREQTSGVSRLRAVEGFGIYEAKKNEVILLADFAANKVTNNARQVFAKVPGLNIWESDFAGLQLDIAARGLGPSRSANFNTRQNGYDMSADALGYPESYYLPAMQAVDRIEIVRGAASLQYGTQFGGMLNFRIKEAPEQPLELNLEQAVGSFGYLNSYLSVGGRSNKLDYFGYYQYRRGDGWRENSGLYAHLGFARIGYQANEQLKLGLEYSLLNYQAQQPGGLTDEDFQRGEIEKSRRERNWFRVSWNLLAATLDYRFSDQTKMNIRSFGLISGRDALGNLNQIDRVDDPTQNRTLIRDNFQNVGAEARLLHYLNVLGKKSALLVGGRYYNGLTDRQQGDVNPSDDPDFTFLNPGDLEDFDYDFPSRNYSLFAENIFNVTDYFSITPGVRFEHIRTDSEGVWKQIVRNFAGDIVAENVFSDNRSVLRSFVLFGIGASYYLQNDLNVYANFSENFRSVTFSDLRLNNPNFVLDSLITDERGFNLDLGVRGAVLPWLDIDMSLFYLRYNNRIGVLLPPATTLLFRTNVGDSRHYGLESYAELDVFKLLGKSNNQTSLSLFTNLSLINATYIESRDTAIKGKRVEYVPNVMLRSGINYSWRDIKTTYQFSYLGDQFSDATNSVSNPSALTGLVPSYHVMDFSVEYTPGRFRITTGVNNFTNQKYFTRRAESYPGPGIIPATIRSFYVSLGVRI